MHARRHGVESAIRLLGQRRLPIPCVIGVPRPTCAVSGAGMRPGSKFQYSTKLPRAPAGETSSIIIFTSALGVRNDGEPWSLSLAGAGPSSEITHQLQAGARKCELNNPATLRAAVRRSWRRRR